MRYAAFGEGSAGSSAFSQRMLVDAGPESLVRRLPLGGDPSALGRT